MSTRADAGHAFLRYPREATKADLRYDALVTRYAGEIEDLKQRIAFVQRQNEEQRKQLCALLAGSAPSPHDLESDARLGRIEKHLERISEFLQIVVATK